MEKRFFSVLGTGLLFLGMIGVAFAGHGYDGHCPELDAGTIGSGFAFLGGSGLLLIERFRRRNR
jgi:hypothetical protein